MKHMISDNKAQTDRQREIQESDAISTAIIATFNKIGEHKYVPRATMGDAPAQAQHSPITHDHSPAENAAIAHMKELRAHAQRLADALTDCVTTPGALAERSHEYALRRLASITETARAALAEWSKQK